MQHHQSAERFASAAILPAVHQRAHLVEHFDLVAQIEVWSARPALQGKLHQRAPAKPLQLAARSSVTRRSAAP